MKTKKYSFFFKGFLQYLHDIYWFYGIVSFFFFPRSFYFVHFLSFILAHTLVLSRSEFCRVTKVEVFSLRTYVYNIFICIYIYLYIYNIIIYICILYTQSVFHCIFSCSVVCACVIRVCLLFACVCMCVCSFHQIDSNKTYKHVNLARRSSTRHRIDNRKLSIVYDNDYLWSQSIVGKTLIRFVFFFLLNFS